MKPHLEDYLWNNMQKKGHGKPFPREVINDMVDKKMICSPKQAWRTLEKWDQKGKYDYGSTLDLGWKNGMD